MVIILKEKPQAGWVRVPFTNATILLSFTTWSSSCSRVMPVMGLPAG
jgi:hypothetical protein